MSEDERYPSLLDPEARGGDTAEGGSVFQDSVVLAKLPGWMAHEGFSAFIRESLGDTEAKFFVPGRGWQIEFLEAKNHRLTGAPFWKEIARFLQMDRAGNDAYFRFTLTCAGLSDDLLPVVNALARIRNSIAFHSATPKIIDQSYKDYAALVKKEGQSPEVARFLFDKVYIEWEWHDAKTSGARLFKDALVATFPVYEERTSKELQRLYTSLYEMIRSRRNQPVVRREIETVLASSGFDLEDRLIRVHTLGSPDDKRDPTSLQVDWRSFFSEQERSFPSTEEWNQHVVGELYRMREWVVQHRTGRHLQLAGSRRLSAMFAFGAVFSAVTGFSVEVNHRGTLWSSDTHAQAETPSFDLRVTEPTTQGEELVVSIGIVRDIQPNVARYLQGGSLVKIPALHLYSEGGISSPAHANKAVAMIKSQITRAIAGLGTQKLHLFFAGPSFLMMLLGHRLNATANIQCYEWLGGSDYTPTCLVRN